VFRHVVNVEDDAGRLFTLASRRVDCAPDTLIVDVADFTGAGIERGDPVARNGDAIVIAGRLEIHIASARLWDCVLPGFPCQLTRLRTNLAAVRERMDGRAGFGALATDCLSLDLRAAATLKKHAARLCDAFCGADLESACMQAQALLGLGAGLTPAGDDFLVGFFAVLHLPAHPCPDWTRICVPVLARVEQRTNTISAAALRAAAAGRVRESIVALLRELMGGAPQDLVAALDRVLAIGSTSGADMVAGVQAGFEAVLQAVQDRSAEACACQ
jgi:hypothetical protein